MSDRLEQAAAIARAAVPLISEEQRHLPDGLDPWAWIILGTGADSPGDRSNTLCRTPGITVKDPRRVTCGDCVAAWNARWPEQFAFPVVLPIPSDTDDRTISDQPPYASITWLDMYDEAEEPPGDDAYDWIDTADTAAKD
ncbi:hypothetical protein AB0N09_05130 [Streptomyces erythrochromogenes]|uniref:hypothetical protein n=1 Tax=Streptomyces erythrochromogenes TaxID=285574 RepID=UPI00343F0294